MKPRTYATAIVLGHLLMNIIHGAAHHKLEIGLNTAEGLFVVVVIVAGPLVAMALLWTRQQRLGYGLLAATMAGSLIFGLYHHFLAMGPDHVAAQAEGFWGTTFVVSACLLLLTEALGVYAGLRFLLARQYN